MIVKWCVLRVDGKWCAKAHQNSASRSDIHTVCGRVLNEYRNIAYARVTCPECLKGLNSE